MTHTHTHTHTHTRTHTHTHTRTHTHTHTHTHTQTHTHTHNKYVAQSPLHMRYCPNIVSMQCAKQVQPLSLENATCQSHWSLNFTLFRMDNIFVCICLVNSSPHK